MVVRPWADISGEPRATACSNNAHPGKSGLAGSLADESHLREIGTKDWLHVRGFQPIAEECAVYAPEIHGVLDVSFREIC